MKCSSCGTLVAEGNRFCTFCGTNLTANRKTSKRWLFWTTGVIGLLASLILAIIDLQLFFRFLALVGILLIIVSVGIMLLTFRKAKRVSPAALLLSMVVALATLVVYTGILGVRLNGFTVAFGLFLGAFVGIIWASTTRIFSDGGTIKRRGNVWYLAVWGFVFAFTQLATVLTGRPPFIAVLLLLFSTGLVFGNSGTLLVRSQRLRTGLAEQRAN